MRTALLPHQQRLVDTAAGTTNAGAEEDHITRLFDDMFAPPKPQKHAPVPPPPSGHIADAPALQPRDIPPVHVVQNSRVPLPMGDCGGNYHSGPGLQLPTGTATGWLRLPGGPYALALAPQDNGDQILYIQRVDTKRTTTVRLLAEIFGSSMLRMLPGYASMPRQLTFITTPQVAHDYRRQITFRRPSRSARYDPNCCAILMCVSGRVYSIAWQPTCRDYVLGYHSFCIG